LHAFQDGPNALLANPGFRCKLVSGRYELTGLNVNAAPFTGGMVGFYEDVDE